MRRIVVGIAAVASLVAACGDSGPPATTALDPSDTQADVDPAAGSLIAELGSDQAAADALIIAMDGGYSGPQILAAVDAGNLLGDGTIDGEEPAGPALGLVLHSSDALSGDDEEETLGSNVDVVLVALLQAAPAPTPIEQLRQNATQALGVGEPATTQILSLLKIGFGADEVIEMLILGIDGLANDPDEPDGPVPCAIVVDEIYCPGGLRYPLEPEQATEPQPDTEVEEAPVPDEAPTGPVSFSGSASQGAIENANSDDLRSADFTATIEASTVTIEATLTVHLWHRGGFEEKFVDQNCGSTYRHVLRFVGPAGNPTDLRATVESSEILEVQGVLCDGDDTERGLLTAGEMSGRFSGKANGLGIDGTITGDWIPLEISAS